MNLAKLQQLRKNQKGFTIVELLIVIVIIVILAALVLNTFNGAQKKARDAKRDSDIKAIATQLEACYNDDSNTQSCNVTGSYPLTLVAGPSGLKSLDPKALSDPKGTAAATATAATIVTSSCNTSSVGGSFSATTPANSATTYQYVYVPLTSAGGPCASGQTLCTTGTCASFAIVYAKENGGSQLKVGLN